MPDHNPIEDRCQHHEVLAPVSEPSLGLFVASTLLLTTALRRFKAEGRLHANLTIGTSLRCGRAELPGLGVSQDLARR